MSIKTFILLLPLALLSFACSAIEKPTASVRGASLGQITSTGMTLNVDVLLNNPNAVALPLTKTGYALSLSGTKILDGSAEPTGSIPAKGSLPVTLPITIVWEDLLKAEQEIIASRGDVPYTLSANLGVGTNTGIPLFDSQSIPLSYSGTLPLKEALRDPVALLKSPAARSLAQKILSSRFGL